MSLKRIFNKFKASNSENKRLYITVQSDAIYLSKTDDLHGDTLVFPIENHWEQTLDVALSSGQYFDFFATIAFCSGHYQTYQIEKPELPENEWSSALPFLLKDFISERVTDIVADAVLLPDGKKIQAYVMNKKLVLSLNEKLTSKNITLHRIVPEEILWGHFQNEINDFMLLHRSIKSDYKIGAYVNGNNRFQRVIRGVVAPLTGNASSELQLDSIALELQRSIDYLSSQLRDTQINHLLVCCDEEEPEALLSALSERLSVKVLSISPLDEQWQCGKVLCRALANLPSAGINLYPDILKPKVDYFTFTNVVASWGVLTVVMVGIYGVLYYQNEQSKVNLTQIKSSNVVLTKQLEGLQAQLIQHKPSAEKIAASKRIELKIDTQKSTLKAIEQFDDALTVGYSGVMSALAQLAGNDISLVEINVSNQQLSLKGLAGSPSSVPGWVKRFKTELNLVGRTFETLSIGRNENDVVTFSLTTQEETNEVDTRVAVPEIGAK